MRLFSTIAEAIANLPKSFGMTGWKDVLLGLFPRVILWAAIVLLLATLATMAKN